MVSLTLIMGRGKQTRAITAAQALAEFVKRVRLEKKLSLSDVEARSKGGITNGYISKIENNQAGQVTLPRLRALALGLGVSEEQVISIATGSVKPSDDHDFIESMYYMLYEKSKSATPEKKEFIKNILRMIDRELEEDRSATR